MYTLPHGNWLHRDERQYSSLCCIYLYNTVDAQQFKTNKPSFLFPPTAGTIGLTLQNIFATASLTPTRLLDVHDQVHAGVNAAINVKCSCRCEGSDNSASNTDVDIRNGGRARLFGGDRVAACIPHAVADNMQHLHVIDQRHF